MIIKQSTTPHLEISKIEPNVSHPMRTELTLITLFEMNNTALAGSVTSQFEADSWLCVSSEYTTQSRHVIDAAYQLTKHNVCTTYSVMIYAIYNTNKMLCCLRNVWQW